MQRTFSLREPNNKNTELDKKSFFAFKPFGEDTIDDIRKLAFGGGVIAGILAGIFRFLPGADWWDFYGQPALTWAIILLGGSVGVFVYQRNFSTFGQEVASELKRVTWPSREEVRKNTMLVLSVMFLFSVTVFVYDLAFGFLFDKVLKLYQ